MINIFWESRIFNWHWLFSFSPTWYLSSSFVETEMGILSTSVTCSTLLYYGFTQSSDHFWSPFFDIILGCKRFACSSVQISPFLSSWIHGHLYHFGTSCRFLSFWVLKAPVLTVSCTFLRYPFDLKQNGLKNFISLHPEFWARSIVPFSL